MSLNKPIKYFNLYKDLVNTVDKTDDEGVPPKKPKPFPQWLALFLGVLTQPFFSYFKEHGDIADWGSLYSSYFLLFGLIAAIIIFPSVYRSSFDPNRPKFLQMIPIFTAGLGWQTMVDSVVKGVSGDGEVEVAYVFLSICEQFVLFV